MSQIRGKAKEIVAEQWKEVRNESKEPEYRGHREHFIFDNKDADKPLEGFVQGGTTIFSKGL